MAYQLNSTSKQGMTQSLLYGMTGGNLKIYTSALSFPSNPIETESSLPAGHILSYTGLTYTVSNTTMSITGGNVTQAATAGGTITWWSLATGNDVIISDSISLSGGNGIVVVSNTAPTTGTQVTVTMNLTIL